MSASVTLLATLGIGFSLGLRHALDTDHVVAVSTLVAREKNLWNSTVIGAIWGLGHTATLFAMGILIIVLGIKIPEGTAPWLQAAVAAMLIFLGARILWQWLRGVGHFCTHQHNAGHSHTHFHLKGQHQCAEANINFKPENTRKGPFLVGMVHGLSGSAELMLLVLTTIQHPAWALIYIAVFGLGMMLTMFALTTLFSLTLKLTSRFQRGGWNRIDLGLRGVSGAASLLFGCYLLWNSPLF